MTLNIDHHETQPPQRRAVCFAVRANARLLPILGLCLLLGILLWTPACSDPSNFEGAYEEDANSGRLNSAVSSTRRYHRLRMLQFDTTLGGIIEYFDVGSFDEFQAQPDYVTSPLQYYHCYRIDSGYVRSNTLYVHYTDPLQQRWQFRFEHDPAKDSIISGTISRLAYNDRVIEMTGESEDTPLLEEDMAWYHSGLKNTHPQISMTEIKGNGKHELDCVGYYRDHTFYVSLPEEIVSGELCSPSPNRCDNLRLGVILTRQDGNSVIAREYLTARLDAYDVDPEQLTRKVRLRELPEIYANSMGNVAFATVFIYEDSDHNGHWTETTDRILASLKDSILVFAPERSHAVIQGITGIAARYDEIVVQTVEAPWIWKSYEATFDKGYKRDGRLSRLVGLGSVRELPLILESTLDSERRGCLLKKNMASQDDPCRGLLPVGEMP